MQRTPHESWDRMVPFDHHTSVNVNSWSSYPTHLCSLFGESTMLNSMVASMHTFGVHDTVSAHGNESLGAKFTKLFQG